MGFIWTTQLESAINSGGPIVTSPTIDVRVALMARSPLLTQGATQIANYKTVTTMADLLSRPGWEEVSVPSYVRGTNVGCTLLTSGANVYFVLGQDTTTFTLGNDSQVEAVVLSLPGNYLGYAPTTQKQYGLATGQAFDAMVTVSNVTNSPHAGIGDSPAVAYDATCRTENEYVVFATDTPFRERGRTIFKSGDGISAQTDSLAGAKWLFGWATSGGSFNALAEGPVSLRLGAPHFESTRLQHVWLFPQRVNYAANPSFEYSTGYWQSNQGALTQLTEASGYPSDKVGYIAGSAPSSVTPQYSPADRLYLRSTKFFPNDRTMTFQLMAKGQGIVRVALASYSRDYTEHTADWGLKEDMFFQEWELSEDHYTKLQGIRMMPDTGYEGSLLIEVRGTLSDPDDFATFQVPHIAIDQCIVEEGTLLEWPYFDGDDTYGATGDHSWYGLAAADKAGKSYSLWYNNQRDINGRLFARRTDDTALYTSYDEQMDSMLSEWVPAGVTIVPHWGALSPSDTFLPPVDNSTSTLAVELWPEEAQFFDLFEVVEASQTGITMRVIGEGGHPISRAFIRSGDTVYPATISTRPWQQPGLRANQVDAALAELYDLSVAQEVVLSWDSVPAFATNTLYIERGNSRSPQSFVVYVLLSAAGAGFGEATGAAYEASVTIAKAVTTITASGTANNATTAYAMLASAATGTGTANDPSTTVAFVSEAAAATSQADVGFVQYGIKPDAGQAAASGAAFGATTTVSTTATDAASTGDANDGSASIVPPLTMGIGVSTAYDVVPVLNDAPNPVTGLSVAYVANGDAWNGVATWALPADVDIASVKIRWRINGGAGVWVTLASTATTHTQAMTSGTTVEVDVQTFDTAGAGSVTIPTFDAGFSPLNAVASVTVTQTGLDEFTATWAHPSGNNRSGYTVTCDSTTAAGTVTLASTATSKVYTFVPGTGLLNSFAIPVITVTPLDNSTGSNRSGRPQTGTTTTTSAAPGTPTVSSWSFTSITITWTQPTWHDGGYYVERSIGTGAFTVVASASAGNSYTGAVSADTDYRYRVRARGSTNYSGYSGNLQPSIGHAAFNTTSAWSSSKSTCNMYLGHSDGVTVPANVTTSTMTTNLSCTFATSLVSGTATRDCYYVAGGVSGFGTGTKADPWTETFSFVTSADGLAGIMVAGTGWSNTSTGGFRLTGTITVNGTLTTAHPTVANSYW